MPGLTVTVILQDIKKLDAEAVMVGFFEDVRPLKGLAGQLDWLLCGSLSSLIIDNKLRGSLGEVGLLTSRGKVPAQKIFMVGLGSRERLTESTLRSAVRSAIVAAINAGVKSMALEYFQAPRLSADAVMPVFQAAFDEGAGERDIDIALLAPDAAAYETMTGHMKGASHRQRRVSPETQPISAD